MDKYEHFPNWDESKETFATFPRCFNKSRGLTVRNKAEKHAHQLDWYLGSDIMPQENKERSDPERK